MPLHCRKDLNGVPLNGIFVPNFADYLWDSGVDTNGGAYQELKIAAQANDRACITHFSASSDAAALYEIVEDLGGLNNRVMWRKRLGGAGSVSENFNPPLITRAKNRSVTFKVGNSTTNAEATYIGFLLPDDAI